jgi:transketolase C-terminal domain/subunit
MNKGASRPRRKTSAMIASIADEGQATKPAPFGHALVELARTRQDIVGMTADLAKYTDLYIFAQAFPDRFYQMGKAKLLCEGKDVLVISSGLMTMRALDVAKALAADSIDLAVLHVPTIKPLDTSTILKEVSRMGRLVVVAENHTMIGGLGEAIAAELLRAGVTPPFRQIALPDAFLKAGSLPMLHERYGISANAMSNSIKRWL